MGGEQQQVSDGGSEIHRLQSAWDNPSAISACPQLRDPRLARGGWAAEVPMGPPAKLTQLLPLEYGAGVLTEQAIVCACGNVFMNDSDFCRKCGKEWPKASSVDRGHEPCQNSPLAWSLEYCQGHQPLC